jgi:hypothetical protein
MDNLLLKGVKNHPENNATIDEVLQNTFDPELMKMALSYTKSESPAQALYVWLKLNKSGN